MMEIDNKPASMSMKDYLIRVLAVKAMMSEKTIEAVVNHQFQSASLAMKTNNSVELSGFGKFYFNMKKAIKRLAFLETKKLYLENVIASPESSEAKLIKAHTYLKNVLLDIEYIKSKTNEPVTDLRGMEEQADSIKASEGTD
jgi:nucleoid DNA-binding protein